MCIRDRMQSGACHPSHILAAAVSGLVKLDSKQAYLEAVNQMAAARTMHEIRALSLIHIL